MKFASSLRQSKPKSSVFLLRYCSYTHRSLQAENPTLIWHICIFANAQSQYKKCKRAKSANAKRRRNEKKGGKHLKKLGCFTLWY